ncbi:MAG: FUN14 domain-containing protein [Candidatus Bathyarchaeia archaeon]
MWSLPLSLIGIGGFSGFLIGYALKKFLKILLIICGFFLFILLLLEYKGIVKIDYAKLGEAMTKIVDKAVQLFPELLQTVTLISYSSSFFLGFLLGFKLG